LLTLLFNLRIKCAKAKVPKDSTEANLQRSLLISKNVTRILEGLLKNYDRRIRPNYAGLFLNVENWF
jgi:hypothetical protein